MTMREKQQAYWAAREAAEKERHHFQDVLSVVRQERELSATEEDRLRKFAEAVRDRVTTLESRVTTLTSANQSLNTRVTALEARVAALELKVP